MRATECGGTSRRKREYVSIIVEYICFLIYDVRLVVKVYTDQVNLYCFRV